MPDSPASPRATGSRPVPGPDGAADDTAGTARFSERLGVPWWWWPVVLVAVALVSTTVALGHPGVLLFASVPVLVAASALVLVRLGRVRVGVRDGATGEPEIVAGRAHLPTRLVGRMDVVEGAGKQQALGPDLDPEAFVVHRPWVGPAVRLEVVDPDDPTPYWVVSTRRPRRLVAAVRAAGS